MHDIPDPNLIFPNEYKTSCFINNGNETCLVSTTENTVQLLHFMFG